MVVQVGEGRMDKRVGGEETAEMRLDIGMEKTVRMVRGAESKFKVLERLRVSDNLEAEGMGPMERMALLQEMSS